MDASKPLERLKDPFEKILSNADFGNVVNDIAEQITHGYLTKVSLEAILNEHNIKDVNHIKKNLLDMILAYISFILNDNFITETEAENIKFLKLFFKIQEGDFYSLKYYEIEEILDRQFEYMYQNNAINQEESLQKVELQELFDLSYDQFLALSQKAVEGAISRGANPIDLDTFIKSS